TCFFSSPAAVMYTWVRMLLDSPIFSARPEAMTRRWATSKSLYLIEELPELITRMITMSPPYPLTQAHGAVHEQATTRVLHRREILQRFQALAGALATGDLDHHIRHGIARHQPLQHRFTSPERAGNTGRASQCNGEKCVDQADGGGQRLTRIAALAQPPAEEA